MAKQTFTTGQVLTAGQMTTLQNNDYNETVSAKVASYTLVAADAGTRITMNNASATTITVNTGLFAAGDTLVITNTGAGASTITAGTATVNTSSSLILAQYDSGVLYFSSTGVAIWQKYMAATSAGMTNPMTTTGDTIYSSPGSTPARLGIGSSGQVLTVSGGVPSWATPSGGGGMTLLSTTTLSGSSTTIGSISGSYTNLLILVFGITGTTTGGEIRLNGATTGVYATKTFTEGSNFYSGFVNNLMTRWNEGNAVSGTNTVSLLVTNYASTTATKVIQNTGGFFNSSTGLSFNQFGWYNSTSAITSITVTADSGTFTTGTVLIYGVK